VAIAEGVFMRSTARGSPALGFELASTSVGANYRPTASYVRAVGKDNLELRLGRVQDALARSKKRPLRSFFS